MDVDTSRRATNIAVKKRWSRQDIVAIAGRKSNGRKNVGETMITIKCMRCGRENKLMPHQRKERGVYWVPSRCECRKGNEALLIGNKLILIGKKKVEP
jgi:hypothetical protein